MMATKQLNSVNPRNFKEKIELLKKKEAASTANFAAAMRDAREIRQIAVACDPTQLHLKSRAVHGVLSKACSVPNVGSTRYISEPPTNRTNSTLIQSCFATDGTSVSPTGNGLPLDQAQVHPSNANGHLMSLLSSPATPSNSLDFGVPVPAGNRASNLHSWPISSNQGINCPNMNTSIPHPFSPRTRATTHCSGSLGGNVLSNTHEALSTHPNRRVHRYASGDQLPSATDSYVPCDNWPTSNGKPYPKHPCTPFSAQPGSTHTASLSHDYPSATPSACIPSHYPPVGRSLYTAQTSLGPLHSSSPYCGTQGIGHYQRAAYDNYYNMQQLTVSYRPSASDSRTPSCTNGFNPSIDWRRVSSDSSIHHSLTSFTTASTEPTVYGGSPPASSGANTGMYHTNLPARSSETLRRHFPAVADGIAQSPSVQRNVSYSPNAVSVSGASLSPHHSPGSLTEEHLLPAKRPFTGLSTQSVGCPGSDHDYTQMSGLSLEDSSKTQVKQPNGHTPTVVDGNPNQVTSVGSSENGAPLASSLSSTSAPNIKQPCGDTRSELNASQAFDPGDLDRYLQIPSALLDCESGETWTGRRNSCTMTAEVLSALNTGHNESPLAVDRTKGEINVGHNSCYSKHLLRSDMPVIAELSTDYDTGSSTAVFGSNHAHSSSFQDVASKLGISMTPNDYQLLTNPQLANYVTDETTETQLLG